MALFNHAVTVIDKCPPGIDISNIYILCWYQILHLTYNKFALLWGEAQLCLPYIAYRKKCMTYSDPIVTYICLKMTYSYPNVNYSGLKVTYS